MTTQNRLFAAADAKKTPAAVPDAPNPIPIDSDRGSRYALRALERECQTVAAAGEGQRDHAINTAAYSMGQLIGAGLLNEDQAVAAIWDAARVTGQPEHEIANALRRGHDRNAATGGITTGRANPRNAQLTDLPATTPPPITVLGEIAEIVSVDIADKVRERLPLIDWHELWTRKNTEDWILEPLLPARRLVALYSAPKVGKSLLMLEIAVAISRGTKVLGARIDRPRRVLYVDFENDPEGDVRERLQAMGVTPTQLDNLCYLSFPTLAHLDTEAGSLELLAAADVYDCEVVIIDTVSRAIGGDENENDTWLNFYRHTGLKLKQAQKALIRLDHTGKDETKGQRGGSAKEGDVDAVWKLSKVTDTTFRLECTHNRMPVTEKTLVLHRHESPLHHSVDALGRVALWDAKVSACQDDLDAGHAGNDISNNDARDLLRANEKGINNDVLAETLRRRKNRLPVFPAPVDNPPLPVDKSFPDRPGTVDEIATINTSRERLGNGNRS